MKNKVRYLSYILTLFLCTVVTQAQQITAYEYFIDKDPGFGKGVFYPVTPTSNLVQDINVSLTNVPYGVHNLYVRVQQDKIWSHSFNSAFYVTQLMGSHKIDKAEYFIDTDPGIANATAIPLSANDSINTSILVPLNSVSKGVHSLYSRVRNNFGNWSLTHNQTFYVESLLVKTPINQIEYFIDNDPGVGKGTKIEISASDSVTNTFVVDLSNVTPTIHFLFVRAKNKDNEWSVVQQRAFLVEQIPITNKINYIEYFIDNDPGLGKGIAIPVTQPSQNSIESLTIDLSSISLGEHNLSVRVRDENKKWSITSVRSFKTCPEIIKKQNLSLCAGDSIFLQKIWQKHNGVYTDTLQTAAGCDSIVITELTVNPKHKKTDVISICEGSNYKGYTESGTYTENLTSVLGCDSIVITELTVNPKYKNTEVISICEGSNYKGHSESGTYTENLTSVFGCDSIVITELTVNPKHKNTEVISICEGSNYKGHSESGTYTENLTSVLGCDSIVITELTVNPKHKNTEVISICEGSNYKGHSESGTYTENLTSVFGCDSIVITELTVNPKHKKTDVISICEGSNYKGHSESGTYTENLTSVFGCDSIVITELTVNPKHKKTDVISICEGSNYKGHSESGTYTENLTSVFGCDSIVTTELTVQPKYKKTDIISICEGSNYKGHSTSGTYTENLTSVFGCDSIVTTELTVQPKYKKTDIISICEGSNYKGHSTSGTYTENLTSVFGCDSIVITELTVNPKHKKTEVISICEGSNYKGHTESGTYTENLTSVFGCDSVVITELTVNPKPTIPIIKLESGILSSNANDGNQWYFGKDILINENNNTLSPAGNGDYYVIVTLNKCSSPQSNIITVTKTLLSDIELENGIKLYPNPTENKIFVEIEKSGSSTALVQVIDNTGNIVFTRPIHLVDRKLVLDLNFIPAGIYYLKINIDNNVFLKKIVKI